MKLTHFEDLKVWKEARKLVNMVYDAIAGSPAFQKDVRLRDQCKGAAISTMGAIPEGFARRSNKEFIQFLFISVSSAAELQSHFYVALDRKYINKEVFDAIYQQADKVGKMDSNLITYLRECDRRYNETKKTRQTR
ncbi:MAG: four helix bundle protein [candidate division WOR-3 bacterium]